MIIGNNDCPSPETDAVLADGTEPIEKANLEVFTAEVGTDLEELRAYTKAKLALAEQLRISGGADCAWTGKRRKVVWGSGEVGRRPLHPGGAWSV